MKNHSDVVNHCDLENHSDLEIQMIHMCMCVCLHSTERMLQMGFTLKEIQESLAENRYDEVCATYMLLAREMKSASVSSVRR